MKPNKRKDDFEGGFSYELVRFSGNGVVTVIVLLLLLPKTPSILCIAPGTHIAVESMYALCCSKPTISHQSVNPHGNGFVAVEDCLRRTVTTACRYLNSIRIYLRKRAHVNLILA